RTQPGAMYALPWWSLGAQWEFHVHFGQYQNTTLCLPTTRPAVLKRRDEEVNNIVRLELPLPHRLTLSGEYQVTHNKSDLQVFDYSRSVLSVILSWTY